MCFNAIVGILLRSVARSGQRGVDRRARSMYGDAEEASQALEDAMHDASRASDRRLEEKIFKIRSQKVQETAAAARVKMRASDL